MPNWCMNTLTITGPSETLEKLIDEVTVQVGKNDHPKLSLERLDATPKALLEAGDMASNVALMVREPIEGEVDDWYTWRVRHWGTKWDIEAELEYDGEDLIESRFDSAWSPPLPACLTLSKRYPDLQITLEFDEPGNDFSGVSVFGGGELLEESSGPSSMGDDDD